MFGEVGPKLAILQNWLTRFFYSDTTNDHNLIIGPNPRPPFPGSQFNTVVGEGAFVGATNASSGKNTIMGYQAGAAITYGNSHVIIGYQAGKALANGGLNVFVGAFAGTANVDGGANTAIGEEALKSNVSFAHNTAIGYTAMKNSDSSAVGGNTYNTAIGSASMVGSATASANIGVNNTAVGFGTLNAYTTGSYNTAIGYLSQDVSSTGDHNTTVGHDAGGGITTGSTNTFIGGNAGVNNTAVTTGGNNTALGYNAGFDNLAANKRTALGYSAICATDNTCQVGDGTLTTLTVGTSNTASVKALNTIKGFCKVTGATGARVNAGSFNVTSITDTAAGDLTVNWTTSFAAATYTVSCSAERSNTTAAGVNSRDVNVKSAGQATGSCAMQCWDKTATTNALKDPAAWHIMAIGTQ